MATRAPLQYAAALEEPVTAPGRALLDRLAEHLPRIRAAAAGNDREGAFPVDTFDAFRKTGLMGATVPARLGGLGVDRLYDAAVALLEVAKADASTALALHMQFSRGLTLGFEWRHGDRRAAALAERLLRLMAAGEAVVCSGIRDHHSVVTTLSPDGSGGWLLSGRKTLVSMGPIGTHFVINAQTDVPGEPPRLVSPVVTRGTRGLAVLDNWDGLGMRASGTVDVVFDDCPVPAGDVLVRDPVGARNDAVLAGQTVSSVAMLGIYAGVAQAARDSTVAAVGRRSAAPGGATRTLLAEIDARLYALRAAAGAALATADGAGADLDGDRSERGRRMMRSFQCAKMLVNQLAPMVVSDCLTLVGGAAYTASHELGRLYRDVRAGGFMQPYTYVDGVDFLSAQALGIDRDNNYMSTWAARPGRNGGAGDAEVAP
ncbi:acyl-CoA/acyl-ACP dehydrogenase [Actinomadura sp. NAK00032]|uniref:acyl-CoA dehydrogenase family protein n=1 Tax=Actinomadura sp. NAK00032 TaxID=2742128 RepID=UPI0015902C19|nr:acyl-CoA dehydrogenase family protein [Actinomadura sp. NAK00032]QKW37566.1 acyl-CoA/acyl-ACP dehydrogenase [Actinomadura sp. NAK00032]